MTGPWTKFRLLMWKNWVLQKRHPVQTLVEILAPVVFSVMLVLVRSLSDPETYPDPTFYQPFSPGNTSGTVLELLANSSVGGLIAYSPSNSLTQSIMKKTAERLDMQLIAAPNESTLIQGLTQTVGAMKLVLAGIVFDDNLSNETIFPDIKVKIRFPGEIRSTFSFTSNSPANWLTNLLFPTYQTKGPRSNTSDVGGNTPGYFPEGFLALQHALSSSLTEVLADTETIPEVLLQRFPYPPYLYDSLLVALQNMVSFIILLSLTYTSISIVKVITSEKELQLKETMKIMGLPNWLHWTAWFVNNFLMLLISVILMVVMLKVPWYSGTDVTVFTHSNWLLIFIFLMLYAVAMICFCFMITSFFSKANSASTVAGLAWFVLFAPYLFIQNNYTELTLSTKLATSLFSNTAMGYGFQLILMHEGTGKGIQWDNVWEPATQDDDLYFGHLIIFMLLDSAIYLLIAIYVEAVFPGAYGVPKPWYFLFQKSFWCESQVARKKMGKENTDFSEKRQEHNFEQEPELPIGVQIRNLHKVTSQLETIIVSCLPP
uniref:ABC-2 type transporter transmembrane domain-containing protein n=1 Tax=Timema bartmani TaxID=61472 RepID=A0A7R9I4R0_9NEOP|nr:unnamed protein product [Timema bartmani]